MIFVAGLALFALPLGRARAGVPVTEGSEPSEAGGTPDPERDTPNAADDAEPGRSTEDAEDGATNLTEGRAADSSPARTVDVTALLAGVLLHPEALAADNEVDKALLVGDADELAPRLPLRGKVKECCGYPIGTERDFRLTFYWLAYELEYAYEPRTVSVFTREGYWIGRYPQKFVDELTLEGSGILMDGRVVNYDGACRYGTGTCFKFLDSGEHPLGRGVQARPLVPYRSIAVDPRVIPIGAPVYVPELVGVELPDGTRHDGCLRADDQGGAIKNHKMDFFVESYFNFKFVADQLWWKLKATPHLDEPRCEYLRLGHARERDNEHSDWAALHNRKLRQAQAQKAKSKHRPVWASSSRHHDSHGKRGHSALTLHSGGGGGSAHARLSRSR